MNKYVLNINRVLLHQQLKHKRKSKSTFINQKILSDLKRDGIAFSNLNEIFPDGDFITKMRKWVADNEKNLYHKSKKKFLLSYFGQQHDLIELDLTNPFFDFYLSERIIHLVSSYLDYVPQLNYVSVEKTIPTETNSGPSQSQNWHRDPEEKKMIKVFIYLNDVNENNGPFIYIKRSQPTGKSPLSRFAPQKLPYGSYPEEKSVLAKVDISDLVTATGTAGTVVFCDTAGLHRGGLSFLGNRIMATGFYPSIRWTEPSLINVPESLRRLGLNSTQVKLLK